jgi:hypothetical protein
LINKNEIIIKNLKIEIIKYENKLFNFKEIIIDKNKEIDKNKKKILTQEDSIKFNKNIENHE